MAPATPAPLNLQRQRGDSRQCSVTEPYKARPSTHVRTRLGLKAASEHGATEHVESSSFDASASLRGASSGVESRKDEDVLDFANGVSSKPAILGAKPARIWPLVFLTDAMLQHWNAWCLLMREGSQGIWNHQTNLRNNQGTLRNKGSETASKSWQPLCFKAPLPQIQGLQDPTRPETSAQALETIAATTKRLS